MVSNKKQIQKMENEIIYSVSTEARLLLFATELLASAESPLTLQELARNSLRRAIGGVHFAARVIRIERLPPALSPFVICQSDIIGLLGGGKI